MFKVRPGEEMCKTKYDQGNGKDKQIKCKNRETNQLCEQRILKGNI